MVNKFREDWSPTPEETALYLDRTVEQAMSALQLILEKIPDEEWFFTAFNYHVIDEVIDYAAAVHLHASDNNVAIPRAPDCLTDWAEIMGVVLFMPEGCEELTKYTVDQEVVYAGDGNVGDNGQLIFTYNGKLVKMYAPGAWFRVEGEVQGVD